MSIAATIGSVVTNIPPIPPTAVSMGDPTQLVDMMPEAPMGSLAPPAVIASPVNPMVLINFMPAAGMGSVTAAGGVIGPGPGVTKTYL